MRGIFVGFGNMGKTHASHFQAAGASVLVAVEPDAGRRAIAEEQGIPTVADWSELSDEIRQAADFVVIATPTDTHAACLAQAIKTGKPIFVEKPAVRTHEEVAALRQLHHQPPIFVAEVEQFNPDFATLKSLLRNARSVSAERLVNLEYFLHGSRPWFLDEAKSGGVALDVMVHDVTLLVAALGRPRVLSALGQTRGLARIDDVTARLQFQNFIATVRCNWAATGATDPITATFTITQRDGSVVSLRSNQYLAPNVPPERNPYLLQAKAFLRAVATGRAPHKLGMYLHAVETCLQICKMIDQPDKSM